MWALDWICNFISMPTRAYFRNLSEYLAFIFFKFVTMNGLKKYNLFLEQLPVIWYARAEKELIIVSTLLFSWDEQQHRSIWIFESTEFYKVEFCMIFRRIELHIFPLHWIRQTVFDRNGQNSHNLNKMNSNSVYWKKWFIDSFQIRSFFCLK